MYKLMIVEDEPFIRAGLKQYFNWEDLGIHTIVEAENGKQGIVTALNEQPDLVITDIRMPEIDGLEMIERLREQLPHTLFVILTGYNEFQYAQRAIHTGGVQKYLLKPLQYDESLKTIEQCMAIIKNNKKEQQTRSRLERESIENLQYKGSQIVKLLLEEEAAIDASSVPSLLQFNCDTYMYTPLVATCLPSSSKLLQPKSKWISDTKQLMEKTARKLLRPDAELLLFTYFSKTKMYAIAVSDAKDFIPSDARIEEKINAMLEQASLNSQLSIYIALGLAAEQLSETGAQLRRLDKSLYQRFFRDERLFPSRLTEPAADYRKEQLVLLQEKDKQAITAALENGNASETKPLMERLAQSIAKSSPDKLLAFLQELISVTLRFAHKNDIAIDGVYSERLFNLTYVDDFHTIDQLFEWIGSWILQLSSIYLEAKGDQDNTQINQLFKQIESFIYEHIDQDVTLQMVADRFFYNPSYLSRLFKNKLNKNYLSFATELRMKYAKRCLEQPQLLITDVSRMCGYKSYKHFVKTFKSVTQMTPSEYRKQLGLS